MIRTPRTGTAPVSRRSPRRGLSLRQWLGLLIVLAGLLLLASQAWQWLGDGAVTGLVPWPAADTMPA